MLFRSQNVTSAAGMDSMVAALSTLGFNAANGLALMVFCLLYVPCTASIATMHRELGSAKKTLGIILYQLAVAWIMSVIVYHIALMF